jgi:two-component system, cell cycle sensor histidine kinase and response regulator CckA
MPIMKRTNKADAKTGKEKKNSLKKLHNLESIINRSPVVYFIWRFSKEAPFEYVSSNIEQWGYTPEDFISGRINWQQIIDPDDISRILAEVIQYIKQKITQFNRNYRIITKSGEVRFVEDRNVFIYESAGKITHLQGAILDVTDRKKTHQALLESENIYRTIFENTGTAMAIADKNRIPLLINDKLQEITGFTKEELIGNKISWENFIAPHDLERLRNYHRLRLADPATAPKHYEYQIMTKSGELKDILMTSALIPGTQNSLVSMMDISAWKKAEEALHKSEERLRELLQNSSDIIAIFDKNGVFYYVSPSVKNILGYDENDIVGKKVFGFIHPDDAQMAINAFNEVTQFLNNGIATEFRFQHKNGHWINLDALGSNLLDNPAINGIVINARNVSERKRMEAQLFHSQKMEAIGTLAGGIAHDFNNILMGIQGYISLLLLNIETIHPEFEKLINIQTLVQNGANLTGKLLGFARGGQYEVKPTDLNELISKTVNLFGRTKKDITFHQKYEKNPWTAEVDRVQIEQVFLNLYVNAWQAMPQRGDIYIETKNITSNKIAPVTNIEAGNYINITITDTGVGMDKETSQRVFEPFFTTKEKGRGVGLGLASAYGIIKEHGGIIDVTSKLGQGTTFNIFLPASKKEVPKETFAAKTIIKGTETILLVDNEDSILDVCREILIALGYNIFIAHNGNEALNIYTINKDKIHLIILDMIMPGLSGSETFDELKLINSEVKVILSTGYSISDQAKKIMASGCQALIQKPFRVADLSQKIREVLDLRQSP